MTKVLVEMGCVVDVVVLSGGVVVLSVGEVVVLSVGELVDDVVGLVSLEVVGVDDVVGVLVLSVGEVELVVGVVSLDVGVGVGVADVLAGVELAWADGEGLDAAASPVGLESPLEAALARRSICLLAWACSAKRKKFSSRRRAWAATMRDSATKSSCIKR